MFNSVVNPIYVCFLHQSITTSNIFIFDLLVDTHVQFYFFIQCVDVSLLQLMPL